MAAAYEKGFFKDLMTPYLGLERDNNMRPDTNMEKLGKLKPAFDKVNGTLTAGNSSPLTDGASCVLLATEEWAKAHNLPVMAYLTFAEVAADRVRQRETKSAAFLLMQ
jgi:acetyl-CoA C-acetyltransferase